MHQTNFMKSNLYLILKFFTTYTLLFFIIINIGVHNIFFYNGFLSLIISGIVTTLIYFRKHSSLVLLTILFSVMFHFSIFLFIPVTIDRSISVNLLQNLDNEYRNKEFDYSVIEKQIINYTSSKQFIEKRIEEQIASKNIQIVGKKYSLTNSGKLIVKMFEAVSKLYGN